MSRGGYPEWSDDEIDRLYDLFPRSAWPELLRAFPGRTRSAIWQMGKNVLKLVREINRRVKWTSEEVIILARMYPTATDAELAKSFSRHSFLAIQRQASALGISRPRAEAREHRRFVHPIVVELYRERRQRHLSRVQLAKKLGHAQGQILGWELGKTKPELQAVCDWAQTLGLEIIIRRVAPSIDTIVIAFPDKQRLMAGRA